MLAISSRSPEAKNLLDEAAHLAAQLHGELFVVHVQQPPTLHYKMPATEHPVPERDLEYASSLGARVIIEHMHGDVAHTLISFARTMGIQYLITGRSKRSLISFKWRLPLTERIQRSLPGVTVLIV